MDEGSDGWERLVELTRSLPRYLLPFIHSFIHLSIHRDITNIVLGIPHGRVQYVQFGGVHERWLKIVRTSCGEAFLEKLGRVDSAWGRVEVIFTK